MKKIVLILLIITTLILAGCSNNNPIKVAFVGGISGKLSEIGVASRNGFLLKVDEINNSGGINGRLIEPHVVDDKNDPTLIPGIYDDLRTQDVEFVVGHILSSMAESVLVEADKEDVLIMSATMTTNLIDNKDDYLIRTATSNSFQAIKMAMTVNKDQQQKIIGVIDQRNKAYTEEFAEVFKNHYAGDLITVPYNADDNSKDALFAAIKEHSPEAVLLITPALDTALMAQRIKILNENINLYSVSWAMSTDLIRNGGDAVEGMKIVYFEKSTKYENKLLNFQKLYKEKYKEESIFVSNLSYEISEILFDTMKSVKKPSPTLVKNAIINHTFKGIESDLTINEFGDRPGKYEIFQVVNGDFKFLE